MTNDALRRAIAERLGYTFVPVGDVPAMGSSWSGAEVVLDPDGVPLHFSALPDWPTDANAALALWDSVSDDWTPRLVRVLIPRGVMTYEYKAAFLHNEKHYEIEAEARTPAEAICRAWLAWREGQAG